MLGLSALTSFAATITKDSPHFIVGEGANYCYVVIDWCGDAKLWGYRWSSETAPTVFDVLRAIDHEDHRLRTAYTGMGSSFVDIYFMGYDVNDSAPQWDVANGGSSDIDALVGREALDWSKWWVFYKDIPAAGYGTTTITSSGTAANATTVQADQVYLFTFGSPEYDSDWNESPITPPDWTPAESPFGYKVVDYYTSESKEEYSNPSNVLHRPTCYMNGQWGGPVNQYNPAWMTDELLSLVDEEDFVTIEFDHNVVDDPNNPWGIDLLVFGNAFGVGKTDSYYTQTTDPTSVSFTGTGSSEPGLVEVSADGETWYSFPDGPYCDDWAPTTGFVYDPDNANADLFSGNLWWGEATDATWPVNTNVTWSSIEDKTLAQVSQCYDKSAGGAGFDIGSIEGLPTDAKGRKYIKYVRIKPYYDEEEEEYTQPEVDAVADVRPATQYEQWKIANYTDWETAWNTNLTGRAAIAANGLPNMVNQVLGLSATESPIISSTTDPVTGVVVEDRLGFNIVGIEPGASYVDLLFRAKGVLSSNCGIKVKTSNDLKTWSEELPSYQTTYQDGTGCTINPLRVSTSGKFFKIVVEE